MSGTSARAVAGSTATGTSAGADTGESAVGMRTNAAEGEIAGATRTNAAGEKSVSVMTIAAAGESANATRTNTVIVIEETGVSGTGVGAAAGAELGPRARAREEDIGIRIDPGNQAAIRGTGDSMRRAWLYLVSALIVPVALLVISTGGAAQPALTEGTPTAIGRGGAVATVETLASEAAVEALRDGANAVDAAVVAAAVLGVTEPFSCGIGGGGFMVIRTRHGDVTTIDHREMAPAAMRPNSFFDGGVPLPFNDARYSGLSAGVPGTVRGWAKALNRFGTMSLREALQPAIEVAREGFVVDQTFFDQTQQNLDYFDDVPSTRAIYLDPDGTPRDVGTVLRNPDLARAYQRIGRLGAKGFYRGAIAAAMVDAVRHPPIAPEANHVWRPGRMTMRDVRDYWAPRREPTRVGYRGLDVYSMGPPSSGGSTDGEALNILEGFDLDASDRVQALHFFLEASRFSFADRNAYLADPDYFDVPLRGLLSEGFAAERRALIDPTTPRRARFLPATPIRTTPPARPPRRRCSRRRPRISPFPTAGATLSPTRTRSSRPAGTASSCPVGASSSTTS